MRFLTTALCIALLSHFAFSQREWRGEGKKYNAALRVDGLKRRYQVYTPVGYDPTQTYPLVFVLHGRLASGKGTPRFTGMNPVADEKGVIVCYPDGYLRSWADDRNSTTAAKRGVDDIAFFNALIDELTAEYSIDGQRIYACGMSNGAFMANSLACHLSDRIAAIAAVTGNLATNPDTYCSDTRPTGILLIGGVDDPLSPYNGGVINENEKGSDALGFPATFEYWRTQNGCTGVMQDSVWADLSPSDGTTVVLHSYTDCHSSVDVVLYEVKGMGHTWPQGPQYGKVERIGVVSQEFNGSRVILEFLLAHTLN